MNTLASWGSSSRLHSAQESAEPGGARVVLDLEEARVAGLIEVSQILLLEIGPLPHRPELDHAEAPPAQSGALLEEERRARRIEANRYRDCDQNWSEQEQQNSADDEIDDPLRDERPGLEHRASELEEGLVVVPDQNRPQSVNPNRARRKQDLTAGVEAFLDQIIDPARGEIRTHDNGFSVVFRDYRGQIVDHAENLHRVVGFRRHVSGNAIVAARSGHGSLEWLSSFRRSDENRRRCPSLAWPHVAQDPFGYLANEQKHDPDGSRGGNHRQHQVRKETAGDSSCPDEKHGTCDSDE